MMFVRSVLPPFPRRGRGREGEGPARRAAPGVVPGGGPTAGRHPVRQAGRQASREGGGFAQGKQGKAQDGWGLLSPSCCCWCLVVVLVLLVCGVRGHSQVEWVWCGVGGVRWWPRSAR